MGGPYRICSRCVMDTSDPGIRFDAAGICSHCHDYEERVAGFMVRDPAERDRLVERIRAAGRGKRYDCVIGVSGGVDSTYVAHLVKCALGLRPLAVHLDNGWNSELAVSNIANALKALDVDLLTNVLDWEEFRDLQLSFLKASVPDAEVPTDHAIVAALHEAAVAEGLKYIISGVNLATEAIMPESWAYGHRDWRYIQDVQRRHGTARLRTFPHFSFSRLAYWKLVRGVHSVHILDYGRYDKREAMQVLEEELGWRPYGGKHYESVYTRWCQGHLFPTKFNIDKRRAHLSTLICSGQMARAAALAELEKETMPADLRGQDTVYVAKKLGVTAEELDRILAQPPRTHHDYRNYDDAAWHRAAFALYRGVRDLVKGRRAAA